MVHIYSQSEDSSNLVYRIYQHLLYFHLNFWNRTIIRFGYKTINDRQSVNIHPTILQRPLNERSQIIKQKHVVQTLKIQMLSSLR